MNFALTLTRRSWRLFYNYGFVLCLCRVFALLWWGRSRDLLKVTGAHTLLWSSERDIFFFCSEFISDHRVYTMILQKSASRSLFRCPAGQMQMQMHPWHWTLKSVPRASTLPPRIWCFYIRRSLIIIFYYWRNCKKKLRKLRNSWM